MPIPAKEGRKCISATFLHGFEACHMKQRIVTTSLLQNANFLGPIYRPPSKSMPTFPCMIYHTPNKLLSNQPPQQPIQNPHRFLRSSGHTHIISSPSPLQTRSQKPKRRSSHESIPTSLNWHWSSPSSSTVHTSHNRHGDSSSDGHNTSGFPCAILEVVIPARFFDLYLSGSVDVDVNF